MSKEKHLADIKNITSIKVKGICEKLGINEKNLYRLKTSESNTKLVKDTLIEELKECIAAIEKSDK